MFLKKKKFKSSRGPADPRDSGRAGGVQGPQNVEKCILSKTIFILYFYNDILIIRYYSVFVFPISTLPCGVQTLPQFLTTYCLARPLGGATSQKPWAKRIW